MTEERLGQDRLVAATNRLYVLDEVERHLKRHRRRRRPFSLLVVDIHNLDWLDRTFGRAIASLAVGSVADLITAHTREVDVWYISTRDRFIVVMDETNSQAAQLVAKRLATAAEGKKFVLGRYSTALEMSFTTASCPDDGVEAKALLQAAGFLSTTTPHA
jgi:diguanylate cyclase (GGDEF)-like protein